MVSSIYSTTFSMASPATRRGIAGLATGMNTEDIIQQMTMQTRVRIAQAQQRQTLVGWRQEAFQSVTSSLIDFRNKFMVSASATNLRNPSFFQSAIITAHGKNSSAVSVTGASSAGLSNFSIKSIDKLATTASFTSPVKASQNAIVSSDISAHLTDGLYRNAIEGGTINLSYNGVNHNIRIRNIEVDPEVAKAVFNGTADSDQLEANAKAIEDAINAGLKEAGLEGRVEARTSSGRPELRVVQQGDVIEINGLSSNVIDALGFRVGDTGRHNTPIRGIWDLTVAANAKDTISYSDFHKTLDGKSITFNLDGINRTITFNESEFAAFNNFKDEDGGKTGIEHLADYLSTKLRTAFGTMSGSTAAKVEVSADPVTGKLSFFTNDSTSILSVASGSSDLIGYDGAKGILGINFADANRLLLNQALTSTNINSGVADWITATPGFAAGTASMDMVINGTTFRIFNDRIVVRPESGTSTTHRFDSGTSMRDIMNTVNNSDAGVRMSYNSTTDSFSVAATQSGTMGSVDMSGGIVVALFGKNFTGDDKLIGEDAVMTVSFDGTTPTTITRSSNNFTLNGLNITLNDTFEAGEDITFTSKANTDTIFNAIKDMIDAYNDIIKMANDHLNTRPNRAFQPLTNEQRREMSKEEIERWEEEAKKGLLFGDPIMRSLATDIRFAFSMPTGNSSLNQIGISVSSSWQDNGKLVIDEARLRQAIESDPERVTDIFTRQATGTATPTSQDAGIMARLDAVMDKYISTTRNANGSYRGLLIQRAGHESAALSLTNNALFRERAEFDRQIASLQAKLTREEQRFARQFASLEQFVARMNEQSSWLMQAFPSNFNQ